ncbi:hypothetical protein EVA_15842 [gut metagenome]|uniref:Uncharacterized protein n=1 Tax=gut metagenome TaxID=749906 RepID=J9FMC2_9ZZZZ
MNCGIKQISLRRRNLTDSPVIITNIFFCGKLSVLVRHIFIYKSIAFINAIHCTGKRSISLCFALFSIAFGYGYSKLLQHIVECSVCYLIPFYRCCLRIRHNITDSRIHFLKYIRSISAD